MGTTDQLDVATVLEAIEALNDGIAIYGPDQKAIYLNGVARQRFGQFYSDLAEFGHREAILRTAQRVGIAPAATEDFVNAYLSHYDSNSTFATQSEDGKFVLASFHPMSNGRKAGISVDVTELRNREKELRKAKKAAEAASASKSAFLANMSHEIRTPLNGIMGMAQVLGGTNLNDAQRDYATLILDSSKTLMALLNDVLDLSKIEAGKFDILAADASLAHVLRRQLKYWRPRAEEKGLDLSLAFDADLPAYLSFDATRVQQCVANLISNAIKFTRSGRVDVFVSATSLEGGDHLIQVRVVDTGEGMDAETMARLFQPFAQADQTTQRQHGGTGLGLSITRRLAELMGGAAWASSEQGRGSTFYVSFRARPAKSAEPQVDTAEALRSSNVREALKSSGLRVLLVDDHPINRQVVSLFLRPFDMRIVEAANGYEALESLARETFDIVLLDMHMPVMDGPTAIARIRQSQEEWAMVPVIALTADAMTGDKERYLAMGMTGYLSKPLAERDLLAEIARVRGEGAWIPTRMAVGA